MQKCPKAIVYKVLPPNTDKFLKKAESIDSAKESTFVQVGSLMFQLMSNKREI